MCIRDRPQESVAAFADLLEMPDGDAYTGAYVQMGQAYEDLGQDDAAERRYKRAIEVDPQSATAYFYLAELYRKQDKLDDAITNFQKALELDPEMSEAQLQLGVAYQASGDIAKAQEIFSQLTGGEGEGTTGTAAAQAYIRLGNLAREQDDTDTAIAQYQAAQKADPTTVAAYVQLAQILSLIHI